MKKITLMTLVSLFLCALTACAQTEKEMSTNQYIENMKLKVTVGDVVLIATLADNPTAKDFISLLPLTVKLDDYASSEKIFYPDRKLSTENAGSINALSGDITYYSPWGNIAIFYKDFGHSSSLIRIARFDGNIDVLRKKSSLNEVKFELVTEE